VPTRAVLGSYAAVNLLYAAYVQFLTFGLAMGA